MKGGVVFFFFFFFFFLFVRTLLEATPRASYHQVAHRLAKKEKAIRTI